MIDKMNALLTQLSFKPGHSTDWKFIFITNEQVREFELIMNTNRVFLETHRVTPEHTIYKWKERGFPAPHK